jgi:hypothetical protein
MADEPEVVAVTVTTPVVVVSEFAGISVVVVQTGPKGERGEKGDQGLPAPSIE